jgi:hypothetical protein
VTGGGEVQWAGGPLAQAVTEALLPLLFYGMPEALLAAPGPVASLRPSLGGSKGVCLTCKLSVVTLSQGAAMLNQRLDCSAGSSNESNREHESNESTAAVPAVVPMLLSNSNAGNGQAGAFLPCSVHLTQVYKWHAL